MLKRFKFSNRIHVPLLPLRDTVVFPGQSVTLFVGRRKSIEAVERSVEREKLIFLVAQKDSSVEDPSQSDIFKVGTICVLSQLVRYPNETLKITVNPVSRAAIKRFSSTQDFIGVFVDIIDEQEVDENESEALKRTLLSYFETYARINRKLSIETVEEIKKHTSLSLLTDAIGANLTTSKIVDKQQLIEESSPVQRAERLIGLLNSEIEIIHLQRRIQSRIRRQMDKDQRNYYLNLQKEAISKELGEHDEFQAEYKELEEKIATKKLSAEARVKAERELKKLKMMSPMSSEAAVIRNYLEWLLSLPWAETTQTKINLGRAREILDEDHYGLEKVKERIVEYIAVEKLVGKVRGPILCFVGPPGVGKTSLGSSIARACGRKFVRVSLGGVRDEAEIRGHRRTYIGAYPGKIIYGLRKVGVGNPVFLLDEVDKMTVDYRGDPAAALLEVLDPEQNSCFVDHFIDVEFDLSRIMFITTANTIEGIPFPLLDRMEVIELSGYTEFEKFHIARNFLLPKAKRACGLGDVDITITDGALRFLIQRYTKEAGVRNLEREIASLCRKIACQVVENEPREWLPKQITTGKVRKLLGVPKYRVSTRERVNEIGLCNGLAFTVYGGDILQVEVTVMPGKEKVILTGKLGEIMRESAQAAVSYLRNRAKLLGIDKDFFQKNDIHVHMPEGGVAKDGPSAGITIATALASVLMSVPVRKDVALTGEITLRGKVLPVGGIKEKLIAASRGRIKKVVMPLENKKNLKDVPEKVLRALKIVLVTHMDEVLREALVMEEIERLFPKKGIEFQLEKRRQKDREFKDRKVIEINDEGEEIRV